MITQNYGYGDAYGNLYSQYVVDDASEYAAENFIPTDLESGLLNISVHAANNHTGDSFSIVIVARYKRVEDTPVLSAVTTYYQSDPAMAMVTCKLVAFIEGSTPVIGLKITGLVSTTILYTIHIKKLSSLIVT